MRIVKMSSIFYKESQKSERCGISWSKVSLIHQTDIVKVKHYCKKFMRAVLHRYRKRVYTNKKIRCIRKVDLFE